MTPTELRAALERLGLPQTGAAKMLGVTDRTVRFWISGKREVPHSVFLTFYLMERFKVSPDEIFALTSASTQPQR